MRREGFVLYKEHLRECHLVATYSMSLYLNIYFCTKFFFSIKQLVKFNSETVQTKVLIPTK